MKRALWRWILVAVLILPATLLIWHQTRPEAIEIIVKPVDQGLVELTVANTRAGTVKACRRAKLSPSIGGQIAKLTVKEGDSVKAGQLMIELWNRDLVAQAALARRETVSSRARAKAVCLKAEVAQRDAQRLLKLRKTGAVSEEKTDKTVTEAKSLEADCAAAKAAELMSNAQLETAEANLARTRLLAPFDGVVAELNGELHEYVTPSPVGIATPPAVDVIDNSCFYVTAPIDEVDTPAIKVGMSARITLDAFGDRRFDGRVRRIADFVLDREKQARTVDVEVEFIDTADIDHLLAGYSADIEVILKVRQDTLRVPTEAVIENKHVFVYLPDRQTIEKRPIETGLSNWDYTEIRSGLSQNEHVVINVDATGIENGAAAAVIEEGP